MARRRIPGGESLPAPKNAAERRARAAEEEMDQQAVALRVDPDVIARNRHDQAVDRATNGDREPTIRMLRRRLTGG